MLHVNQLIGFGAAAGGGPVTLVNRATLVVDNVNSSTYTFSAVAIGAASSTRLVIVGAAVDVNVSPNASITAVTIGGISATIHETIGTTVNPMAIASAVVPTGTTADVVVTLDNTMGSCAVKVHAIDNLLSTTPVDTAQSSANPPSVTIDWMADGYVFGFAVSGSSSDSFTWTGLPEIQDTQGGEATFSSADSFPTTTATGQTVTADPTSSAPKLCVVSFR